MVFAAILQSYLVNVSYVFWLTWEGLGIFPEELEEVDVGRDVCSSCYSHELTQEQVADNEWLNYVNALNSDCLNECDSI